MPTPRLTPALTALMAATAGLGAANIYYAQPMIGLIQSSFGVHGSAAALVSTASQAGYTIGIVFLVPLGDRIDRRRIILVLAAVLVLALLAAAAAPGLSWLILAAIPIGVAGTLAQQAVPLAAGLAEPSARGAVIGRVVSGLLAGILLARALSGVVGQYFGWRAMFCLGAAFAACLFAAVWRAVPTVPPVSRQAYPALLLSLLALWKSHPELRRAAIVQGCVFGGFTAFWSALALYLAGPGFALGADAAGSFGVLGLAGVLVAPLAGRMTDRYGPWSIALCGLVLALLGWLALGLIPGLVGIGLGVILLDAGIQATLVGNQAQVFSLDPAAQSRLNTVFVAGIFLGGSAGSVCGSLAWLVAGWTGIIGVGAAFTIVALAVHGLGRRVQLASVALLCLVAAPASAQALFTPDQAARLDATIRGVMATGNLPSVAVGVFVPGKGAYRFAEGIADLSTGARRTIDQPFRIASITKTFVATAVLQLIDRGLLSKADRLAQWFPDFPTADAITVDDLLRMRSGIAAPSDEEIVHAIYDNPAMPAPSLAQMMDQSAGLASAFRPPDTVGVYTNLNYFILGGIVERVTGADLRTVITDGILHPLGLSQTSYPTASALPGGLHGYGWESRLDRFLDKTAFNPALGGAAGAMTSTIADLERYVIAVCTGTLLRPETQRARMDGQELQGTGVAYGEGLISNKGLCGHSGTVPGFSTDLYYIERLGAAVIVSVNRLDRDDVLQTGAVRTAVFAAIEQRFQ